MDFDIIINAVAVLAIVLPIGAVWAAIRIHRIARRNKRIVALRERSQAAWIQALTATIGGVIGANRLIEYSTDTRFIPRELALIGLIAIILLTSVPNILWLWRYERGGFHDGDT